MIRKGHINGCLGCDEEGYFPIMFLVFSRTIHIIWYDTFSRVKINLIGTTKFSFSCVGLVFYCCWVAPWWWWFFLWWTSLTCILWVILITSGSKKLNKIPFLVISFFVLCYFPSYNPSLYFSNFGFDLVWLVSSNLLWAYISTLWILYVFCCCDIICVCCDLSG